MRRATPRRATLQRGGDTTRRSTRHAPPARSRPARTASARDKRNRTESESDHSDVDRVAARSGLLHSRTSPRISDQSGREHVAVCPRMVEIRVNQSYITGVSLYLRLRSMLHSVSARGVPCSTVVHYATTFVRSFVLANQWPRSRRRLPPPPPRRRPPLFCSRRRRSRSHRIRRHTERAVP